MDSFGEWNLCSSILSLEELDFTPSDIMGFSGISDTAADWFSSLDHSSISLSNSIHQVPHISASDDHICTDIGSILSSFTDFLSEEITAFEDKCKNIDDVHQGDKAISIPTLALNQKRKSDISADEKVNNKRIRASKNKNRKTTESNKRCHNSEKENGGSDSQYNSCNSYTSEDDNSNTSSQETNINGGGNVEGEISPPDLNLNCKVRASRGSASDPQSLYARKRREKINERLRILQKLVPNGTKVDISTMLEEAVHYVKFLQLQIKLLSSDDMWMYAPIAYNGMDIGLHQNISPFL